MADILISYSLGYSARAVINAFLVINDFNKDNRYEKGDMRMAFAECVISLCCMHLR